MVPELRGGQCVLELLDGLLDLRPRGDLLPRLLTGLDGLLDRGLGDDLVPGFLARLGQLVVQLQRGLGVLVDGLAQLGRVQLPAQALDLVRQLGDVLADGLGALGHVLAGLADGVRDGVAGEVARAERGEQRGADLVEGGLALFGLGGGHADSLFSAAAVSVLWGAGALSVAERAAAFSRRNDS